jgi:nucleotide-binding universal stress UspA family protein
VGQRDPNVPTRAGVADFVAEVLLSVGQPVLVVPFGETARTLGERVVVAWSGTRESARAVGDALPLLERAQSVLVLAGAAATSAQGRVPALAKGMIRTLERHGVRVQTEDLGRHRFDVGERILARCTSFQADLLVMGAYGHSRARELVLGGVTQTLLESMSVPVLMSH